MQQLQIQASRPEAMFRVDGMRQCSDGVGGRMTLGAWATGPDGRPALGATAVLADEVLGYALMASLPHGSWSISTEIWLDLVGELPRAGESVVGHAVPVQAGSYAAGELRDGAGRLLVTCRQRGRHAAPPDRHVASPAASGAPPGHDLESVLGMRRADGGWVLAVTDDIANPLGMLHGGVSLAASEVVAIRSRLAADSDLRTTSVHIVHTRGVPVGADIAFRFDTRYAGRSLWVTDVVGAVEGKVCTTATITAEA
ncbi:PaaI family thioesterase [Nocardioides sambongensis]|uniref:PaaI family thioesterase n=1 Tax=Nocardioides sambongensis TaxID=2589074 RepID=UPI0011296F02|nr:hypothetical protein [Nocardioides sambongensis]